jgi:hypothetical protein
MQTPKHHRETGARQGLCLSAPVPGQAILQDVPARLELDAARKQSICAGGHNGAGKLFIGGSLRCSVAVQDGRWGAEGS